MVAHVRSNAAGRLDEQDLEAPRPMNPFDPIELDVAGGARPRDEGERPARALQGTDRLGHGGDDLGALDEAHVQVGDEGQRTPARAFSAVEHDGAGLRDGQGAAGEGAVEGVEGVRAEAVVLYELETVRTP